MKFTRLKEDTRSYDISVSTTSHFGDSNIEISADRLSSNIPSQDNQNQRLLKPSYYEHTLDMMVYKQNPFVTDLKFRLLVAPRECIADQGGLR